MPAQNSLTKQKGEKPNSEISLSRSLVSVHSRSSTSLSLGVILKILNKCVYIGDRCYFLSSFSKKMEFIYQPYIDPEFESLIERIYPPRYYLTNIELTTHPFLSCVIQLYFVVSFIWFFLFHINQCLTLLVWCCRVCIDNDACEDCTLVKVRFNSL